MTLNEYTFRHRVRNWPDYSRNPITGSWVRRTGCEGDGRGLTGLTGYRDAGLEPGELRPLRILNEERAEDG